MRKLALLCAPSLLLGSIAFVEACSDAETSGVASTPDAAQSDSSAASDADVLPPLDAAGDVATVDASGVLAFAGLVYAGRYNNIDQRTPAVVFGGDGRILGYDASANEAPYATTAKVDGIFDDAFAASSRWTDGDIAGPFYAASGTKPIPKNDGQHLGVAKVPGNLPASGSATYALAAATKPTMADGQIVEGTVSSASLVAQFAGNGGTRLGYTFEVAMPDGTFTLVANGGPSSIGDAGGTYSGVDGGFRFGGNDLVVTTSAATCGPDGGPCPTGGASRVVYSGPNAERIVIAYVFGSGQLATVRRGVLVFKRQ